MPGGAAKHLIKPTRTERMMAIIAYTGAHGTGKTTAALQKAELLKRKHPDKSITILTETAPLSPYPINLATTSDSQMWIFTTQIKRELDLLARFDMVVSDRCSVDAIAYTMAAGYDNMAFGMIDLIKYHLHHYDQIIMKTTERNNFCFADGIRVTGDAFRKEVERCLTEIYGALDVDGVLSYE